MHQIPVLIAVVKDGSTDEIREGSPWTMVFMDDFRVCSKRRETEEVLVCRVVKVRSSKTEKMCVNKRQGDGKESTGEMEWVEQSGRNYLRMKGIYKHGESLQKKKKSLSHLHICHCRWQ